jgi:hypothetical protein
VVLIVPLKRYFKERREGEIPALSTSEISVSETEEPEPGILPDETRYLYYGMLEDDQKVIYRNALEAASAGEKTFEPDILILSEQVKPALEALY